MLNEQEALQIVKDARTVAVYGMQDEAHMDRPAYQIPAVLKQRGLKLYPVNPKIESSLGEKALASLNDLPVVVDILDVFRRSDAIPELADEIIALPPSKRPKVIWLQTGISHPEAEAKLEAAGFKVISDACLGVFAARVR
ncbi:MAG TPA: CoA-binding protein [bacterium]|jgi:predicted CoA-binding protein|nr:CoA-binding protein [bacterium]